MSRPYVTKIVENVTENQMIDRDIFRDFEDESDKTRKIYNVWSFGKATNNVKHFGKSTPTSCARGL